MKLAVCLLLVAVAAPAAASAATPIQKVLDLLAGMVAKGKAEKHAEQVQYAAYKQFCDDTSMEKEAAIEAAEKRIKLLLAEIEKFAADITKLGKEIEGHEEDISVWKGDQVAAGKVRAIEKADYDASHTDYTESIEAIEMALAVLKKQAFENPAAMLQVANRIKSQNLIPPAAKRAMDAFIAEGDADFDVMPAAVGDVNSPEAAAYENQSGGVVGMLEKLLTKFQDERTNLEKDEMGAQHAFDMVMQDLKAQIEAAEDDVSDKTTTKAKRKLAKATAEADLADTKASHDADTKYLEELTATCSQKGTDFEARQQLRAEELEAIGKAIDLISGGAVAGSAEKHGLHSLVQEAKAASLAQLRAVSLSPAQERVAQYLRDQAGRTGSRLLSTLAVRAAGDPMKKVKKMIQDLIYRLMEEATAEASQKGWCDTELSTNAKTRKEKTDEVDGLRAEIDQLQASIALLKEDIAELTTAIKDLDVAMATATHLRAEEKAKNLETISDAQAAQTAVAQALTVLKDFYSKAAESTALLQGSRQEPPPIFEEPLKGQQGENTGVVGMLEVIESDFARLEAETKAAEAAAAAEYNKFMHDSELDKTAKAKDVEHKTGTLQDDEQALVSKQDDLEGAEKELHAAMEYFDKLKPSCVDSGISYDSRVSQRKEELESLQEALRILNGESMP